MRLMSSDEPIIVSCTSRVRVRWSQAEMADAADLPLPDADEDVEEMETDDVEGGVEERVQVSVVFPSCFRKVVTK